MARIPQRGPRPSVDLQTLVERDTGFSQKEETGALNPPGTFASHIEGEETVENVTTRDIAAYRRRHHRELTQPGVYLGGYREGETTYLDQSRRFTGPTRVEEALNWGRRQGQVSVYDVDDDEVHFTHTSPDVPEGQEFDYSEKMAQGTRKQWAARGVPEGPSRTRHVEEMVDSVQQAQGITNPSQKFGAARPIHDIPETTQMKPRR